METTKATHTPGPWIKSSKWPAPNGGYSITAADSHVADVYAGHHPNDAVTAEIGEANADLISAAPDLLAACELARGVIQARNDATLPICKGDLAAYDMLTAAIRKAKGGAA